MKHLVNGMAAAVRRLPWVVIIATVVIAFVLGGLGRRFQPEEDSNESFAPAAPALEAADRIEQLFGSTESLVQVILSSDTGDVITTDGLASVQAVSEAIAQGALGDRLSPRADRPAIVSYMALLPQSGTEPGSDQELKEAYTRSIAEAPLSQAALVGQLLPDGVDPLSAVSGKGLVIAFVEGPDSNDEFDAFVDLNVLAAEQIRDADLPSGFTAEPFSLSLLFGDQDEFQTEVSRLLLTAVFIIIAVLILVFLLIPRRTSRKVLTVGGLVLLVTVPVLLVLPGLAQLFPDTFPESWADWELGPLLAIAAAISLLVFTLWSVLSKPLRRTVADTLVTLVTIFFAISIMNGYGYLRFGEANPMVQIIPILLIGLGVDYSIHMTSRYREEVSTGKSSVDDSIGISIKTVGVALVLATVTTAVGFLTNVFNEIPALREFGELAAVGIVASFVLMLTFVPAVRELLDRKAERNSTLDTESLTGGDSRALPRIIGKTSWLARKVPVATLSVALVLGLLGAWGTTQLETKFSFIDFVPTTSPVRDTFQTLIDEFGPRETTQVLIESDVAAAEGWNAMAESYANLSDTENVLVVAGNADAESPVSFIALLTRPDSDNFSPSVAAAATAVGLGEDLRVAGGTDVTSLYDVAFSANPDLMGRVLSVTPEGAYQAALFTITTQAGEPGAAQLDDDLQRDFTPATAVGLSAVPTSSEIINDVVVTTLRDSQLSSLLLTLAVALVLLVINFWVEARRPFLGVITTAPVVLVVLWAFAIMSATGIPFGPVTATVSALAIGIGIPYMIHITHRYQEDRLRCESADHAVQNTLVHTGGALAGSALTTVAGFGILVTSTTIPFRQFGFVTAYTILLALGAAILVLPSMLVLWDNWHRRRGEDPVDRTAVEAALQETIEVE